MTTSKLGRFIKGGDPLVMVTAYDVTSARLAEAAGVDLILVGDSAAMVVLGEPDTTGISLDQMIVFGAAVSRGTSTVPIIGDLPRGSYEADDRLAVHSAERFVREGGVDLVKLEGGGLMVDRVRAVVRSGIPVVGHLGLLPQSVHELGGYRAQAKQATEALALLEDAQAIAQAGATGLVLEAIPPEVAAAVTQALSIPTIGIGAGSGVDGQVLVWHDMLGLTAPPLARFVKSYADLTGIISKALGEFVREVRNRGYPEPKHTYAMPPEELSRFRQTLGHLTRSTGNGGHEAE